MIAIFSFDLVSRQKHSWTYTYTHTHFFVVISTDALLWSLTCRLKIYWNLFNMTYIRVRYWPQGKLHCICSNIFTSGICVTVCMYFCGIDLWICGCCLSKPHRQHSEINLTQTLNYNQNVFFSLISMQIAWYLLFSYNWNQKQKLIIINFSFEKYFFLIIWKNKCYMKCNEYIIKKNFPISFEIIIRKLRLKIWTFLKQ